MPKYAVREGEQVQRNGRLYLAGKVLDLTPEEADAMDWAVEPVAEPKAEKKESAEKPAAKKTAAKKTKK